jgi:hypothetical protein
MLNNVSMILRILELLFRRPGIKGSGAFEKVAIRHAAFPLMRISARDFRKPGSAGLQIS